jgi:purine-nucleoside phosphorylase
MNINLTEVKASADFIKSKIKETPTIGVVLGSGLGEFANSIENKIEISYGEIPGFHTSTVVGHAGKLVIGQLNGKTVAVMAGRSHAYEGHSVTDVVRPVRVLATLGVKDVILTNASGGINKSFHPGQLVLIKDHINMSGMNPLIGKNDKSVGTRFPDMTFAYSPELREKAHQASSELGYKLEEGVYAGVMGPTYETPAEVRMLGVLGADMVGMSTVNETIAAVHMGVNVLGISCITNMAAGIEKGKLSHSDIKDQAAKAMQTFIDLLKMVIKDI